MAAQTAVGRAPLVPEILLHLASEITPIWQATEVFLAQANIEPPFWAFAWPGGQALARHVLDHPELVAGRRVLGAEIDPVAVAAFAANAALNGVRAAATAEDLVGRECAWDLILCGDVCYEAPMTRHILPWLRRLAGLAEVWVADPGRAYLPREGMVAFADYAVATTLELEDRLERRVVLYRMAA